jgi:adenine-specific DNA-methyltransferase
VERIEVASARKARGAFFTPPAIADYFAEWAVGDDSSARVLDPSCGDGVFLLAASRRLAQLGCTRKALRDQVYGVDPHRPSLKQAERNLGSEHLDATLLARDFFSLATPAQLGCPLPEMDAVIGNPPFVRYQHHAGAARKLSAGAALAQGVRLSGLASSWAALLVHACAFLKPEGRLAMVLPAELLTVHYAEPIRRWLRQRFAAVHLVMFERLQFADALEKVVLVVAHGSGGCEAFSLYPVPDADDLCRLRPFDHFNVTPANEGKWTDLLLTIPQRQAFNRVLSTRFVPLESYGPPELGTVTGSNDYFTLSESVRQHFGIEEHHLRRISPPGTRHFRGTSFTERDWRELRDQGQRVWLLAPDEPLSRGLRRYLTHGEAMGVPEAYKCRVRTPWWRPPAVSPPDLFFTYMSHRYPRLIRNSARVTFVNSMHGVRLRRGLPPITRSALPLVALNSITMLGAEVYGRSYGGGVLKMEPREAADLPVPAPAALADAWKVLQHERERLERELARGLWTGVVKRIDEVLADVLRLRPSDVNEIREAAQELRRRRLGTERNTASA